MRCISGIVEAGSCLLGRWGWGNKGWFVGEDRGEGC